MLDRARAANRTPKKPAAPAAPPTPSTAPARAAAGPLKRKLEAAEAALARETGLFAEIEAALADPTLYADPAKLAEVNERHARLKARLADAEAAWMAAAEVYEAVAGG